MFEIAAQDWTPSTPQTFVLQQSEMFNCVELCCTVDTLQIARNLFFQSSENKTHVK